MKRNLIAIIAYPISLILVEIVTLNLFFDLEDTISLGARIFLIYFPLLISGAISGWLAINRPIRTVVYGALILPTLYLIVSPFLTWSFFNSPEPEIQGILASIPNIDFNYAILSILFMIIFFVPLILSLSIVGGLVGWFLKTNLEKL